MARQWVSDTFYAARVKYRNKGGYEWEKTYGPYASAGTAQGQITADTNWMKRTGGEILDGTTLLKGTVTWEEVDYVADKKERARLKRLEKKQAELDRIKAKQDEFWDELNG